jgi:hypothetical protein
MADQRTAQFSGPKGLAKPRLSPEPAQAAAKPVAPARGMSAQSNVITSAALQSPRHPATPPLITGETEFIKPQQSVGPGKKQVVGSSAPPPRAMGFAAAPARAPAPGAEMSPALLHAASVSAPDAYAAVSPVPHPVVDQRSHPIAIAIAEPDRSVPTLPPTERLGLSETSGARPDATEAIDASMLVEVTSNSGTDREIYPVRAPHEGTDPSREIHPQGVPPTHSRGIPVAPTSRGSAIALLLVGLLLVAVVSVSITWWLFTRNKDEGRVAAGGGQAATTKDTPGDASKEPPKEPSPGTETKAAPLPPTEPQPSDVQIEVASTGLPTDAIDADVTAAAEQVEAVESGSNADEGEQEEGPKGDGPMNTPPVKEQEKPKTTTVIASALPSIVTGEVFIGGVKIAIPKGQSVKKKLTSGKKKVEWRTDPKAPLKPAKAVVLEPGKTIKLQLTFTGPRVLPS